MSMYFLYCDESGNSGSHFLDLQQPVHVAAGFLVPEGKRDDLCRSVESLEAPRRQHGGEVKGKKLLKTQKGIDDLTCFVHDAMQAGCVPVYQSWEKRYCVAAKMVEALFDPFYNARASWIPAGANVDRQDLAARILEILPIGHLAHFAGVYRNPTIGGVTEIIERLGVAFELLGEVRLSDTVRGNSSSTIFETEFSGNGANPRFEEASLNYPAFMQLVRGGASMTPPDALGLEVVHDETREFQAAFERGFSYLKAFGDSRWIVLQDGRPRLPGVSRDTKFRTGASDVEPELRAADYLATAVRGLGESALAGLVDDERLFPLAALLLPILLFEEQFSQLLGSPRFGGGHMALLGNAMDAGYLDEERFGKPKRRNKPHRRR